MGYSGAQGTLIYEKNLKSKISCQTPFNIIKIVTHLEVTLQNVKQPKSGRNSGHVRKSGIYGKSIGNQIQHFHLDTDPDPKPNPSYATTVKQFNFYIASIYLFKFPSFLLKMTSKITSRRLQVLQHS